MEVEEEAYEESLQSAPQISAEELVDLQCKLKKGRAKHRAQEAMALNEITRLIPPGVAQRGGHGNVHTPKDEHAPAHEGFADKLKHKVFGKK